MDLNIEKFDPIKKELHELEQNCNKLVSSDGKTGYDVIKSTRIVLKNKRRAIINEFTADREISNAYSASNLKLQRELVGIIEPLERKLEDKQKAVDLETFIEKQKELLPERKERLEEIEVELTDREILVIKEKDFEAFFTEKKGEFLEEKERALTAERNKIEEDKRIEEAKKKAEKKAREEELARVELAKKQAELDKQKAIEEERRKAREEADRIEKEKQKAIQKAEDEKQAIINEQERKERERIEAEEQAKKDVEEQERLKKEEEEKLAKKKKYIKFLKDNGYNEKNKAGFKVEWEGKTATLWKKIDELTV